MMRCNTFARSALFAAVAAAGCLPWALLASPIVGPWSAQALYLVGTTALYIAGLSPGSARGGPALARATRRLTIAIVSGLVAATLALLARTTTELAIGLAALLGVARSGFLYGATPAGAAVKEITLLVGGLLFARFLAGSSPASTSLALWGFLLVQSVFFLGGRTRPLLAAVRSIDPFEEAHRRALALLERAGV